MLSLPQAMHMTVIGSVHAIWMCCLAMGRKPAAEGAETDAAAAAEDID